MPNTRIMPPVNLVKLPKPVKGMVWTHATRTNWRDEPVTLTVTSVTMRPHPKTGVSRPIVYSIDDLRMKVKTPLSMWPRFVRDVVSVPDAVDADRGPRLTPAQCRDLFERAHLAGIFAGDQASPTPMIVQQHANPLDDSSPVVREWEPVMDGVCGFAYVSVRPGYSSFARWLKATGHGHRAYYGGVDMSVRPYGQSMERKGAYAAAFATVLREAGIKSYSYTRID